MIWYVGFVVSYAAAMSLLVLPESPQRERGYWTLIACGLAFMVAKFVLRQ